MPPLQTCACVDLSVDLAAAALELLRGTIERAAEAAKEAVRAQLLRELDAEEEVRAALGPKPLGRHETKTYARILSPQTCAPISSPQSSAVAEEAAEEAVQALGLRAWRACAPRAYVA